MHETLCFVQFLHPGAEHRPDNGSVKRWNTREHKRKFLVGPGTYVDGDKLLPGEIEFWGEWEPESRVKAIADPTPHGPAPLRLPAILRHAGVLRGIAEYRSFHFWRAVPLHRMSATDEKRCHATALPQAGISDSFWIS